MIYGNLKSHKKAEPHPLFETYDLGKTRRRDQIDTPLPLPTPHSPTPTILELSKLIHRIDRKWMTASCDLVFALTQEKNGTTNFLKNYNFLNKFGVLFVLKFRVLQIKA